MIRRNAVTVAIEDALSQLRTPSIVSLVGVGKVRLDGDDIEPPMVLVSNLDGLGGPSSNLEGIELMSTVALSIVAIVSAKDLALADQIDSQIRRQLLDTPRFSPRKVSSGWVDSVTLQSPVSHSYSERAGEKRLLHHGGIYRFSVRGDEIA